MIILIIKLIIVPIVFYLMMRLMADGWFCVFGNHLWTGTFHSCDIDRITPHELRYDCGMCGKEKRVRPGSRKWKEHWAKVRLNLESSEWKEHRAVYLLHERHEIDITSGDLVA